MMIEIVRFTRTISYQTYAKGTGMGQRLTKGDVAKIEAEIEHRKVDLRTQLT